MKIAIISVTEPGKIISDKIYESLINHPLIFEITQYHKNVIKTVEDIFDKYDYIIGIMASGIMIRAIAPHVTSKLSDPAIILIDDNANFVISLLSGHFGGANDFTVKISEILGSTAVITTSTDVNNKTGIDSIAKRYYCSLENPKNIKYINRALIDNNSVDLFIPTNYYSIFDKEIFDSYNVVVDDNIDYIRAVFDNHDVILKPKTLVMGIGARRDITESKVEHAISEACNILEVPFSRIDYCATASVKSKEKGILNIMNKFDKTLKIVSMEDIESFDNDECSKSDFVMKQFGVRGVCEPCCLLANGAESHILFKKTAYNGVTIAVSIE